MVNVRLLFGLVKALVRDPGFASDLVGLFSERARHLEAVEAGFGCEACESTGVTTLGLER